MSHVSLRDLTVRYGRLPALRNITVDIPDEQITTIIGPSGCGKTTLLRSLNRLVDLNAEVRIEGQVLVDGCNIHDPKADILSLRKKVGFLPQRPYPLPMSIYDNVAFGPRIHARSRKQILDQVEELLRRCPIDGLAVAGPGHEESGRNREMNLLVEAYLRLAGLWDEVKDRLNAPASRLSVGQQQRLALARTLAVEPEVILADEPTSALDPASAKLVETQFRLLKDYYTIVVVTHILRQARRIADYVIFLYLGELIEHGPAQEVFGSPRCERTRAYIFGEIS